MVPSGLCVCDSLNIYPCGHGQTGLARGRVRNQEILHRVHFTGHQVSLFSLSFYVTVEPYLIQFSHWKEKVTLESFTSLFILQLCPALYAQAYYVILVNQSPVKLRSLSQKTKSFSCSFFPFQQQLKEKMSPYYSPSPAESPVDILPVCGRLFKNTRLIIP